MKEFSLETLTDEHFIDGFTCGIEPLENWLKNSANRAQKQGSARTKVLVPHDRKNVLGYYSIAPTSVERATLPAAAAGGISVVPAFLLARLALSSQMQGQGLGGELLAAALRDIIAASKLVGGRVIVVDALDEKALSFYQHYGFKRIGNSRRLYERISALSGS